MQVRILMVSLLLTLGLLSASAQSPRRVALVIGNANYESATALNNPARDAALISAALRRAGFTTIDARSDLNLQGFQSALRSFAGNARGAEVALVYFAGHGMEANGQNWLLPIDARLRADTDLEFEAIRLESVLRSVEGARIRIVVLDACRDNPLTRTMRRYSPTRAVTRGLAGIEQDDVLVMYAAAAGQTAADGTGVNSPFALALSRRLPETALELRLMAGKVRDDVLAATNGTQRPFISASMTGEALYLVPGRPIAGSTNPSPAATSGKGGPPDPVWPPPPPPLQVIMGRASGVEIIYERLTYARTRTGGRHIMTIQVANKSLNDIGLALRGGSRPFDTDMSLSDANGGLCTIHTLGTEIGSLQAVPMTMRGLSECDACYSAVAAGTTSRQTIIFEDRSCESAIGSSQGIQVQGTLLVRSGGQITALHIGARDLRATRTANSK
jgi:hypothetical protein